jgi:hypothetical protein
LKVYRLPDIVASAIHDLYLGQVGRGGSGFRHALIPNFGTDLAHAPRKENHQVQGAQSPAGGCRSHIGLKARGLYQLPVRGTYTNFCLTLDPLPDLAWDIEPVAASLHLLVTGVGMQPACPASGPHVL